MATLRIATIQDSPRLAEIFAPYVLGTAFTFAETPPTAAEFESKISDILPDYPFLVCEENGVVLAYAYASKHRALTAYRWCAEVSIYAAPEARQKGAASLLYTALIELLRRQGIKNLYAGITLPNLPSVALHEKFGFQFFAKFERVGHKLGEWRDVGWWRLELGEASAAKPQEPIPFAALQEKHSTTISHILGLEVR